MNIIETFIIVIRTKPGEKLLSRFVVIDTKNNAFVKNETKKRTASWGVELRRLCLSNDFSKFLLHQTDAARIKHEKQTNKQNKTQKETMRL